MLARVVCAFYWFHPLVWVAWHRLRLDSERACDDGVRDGQTGLRMRSSCCCWRAASTRGPPSGCSWRAEPISRRGLRRSSILPSVAIDRTTVEDRDRTRRHAGAAGDRAGAGRARVCDAHRQPARSVRWRGRKCEVLSGADRRPRVVSGTDRSDRPLRLQGAPAGTYRLAAPMDLYRPPRSRSQRAPPRSATFEWRWKR